MPLSLPVHLCRKTLSMEGVLAQLHSETCTGMETRERERIPVWAPSAVLTPGLIPPVGSGTTHYCCFFDQAGCQPVPGRHDGAAGQRAEREGLSHSEDQVALTQETSPRVPVSCSLGAPFPSSSLCNWPVVLSRSGVFEAFVSGWGLLISAHSRKFQRLRYLICKKREKIW